MIFLHINKLIMAAKTAIGSAMVLNTSVVYASEAIIATHLKIHHVTFILPYAKLTQQDSDASTAPSLTYANFALKYQN